MERLSQLEVNSRLITLAEAFLADRSECVRLNAALSSPSVSQKGKCFIYSSHKQQGSVLRHSVPSLAERSVHVYADDIALYCSANSLQLAVENLQHSFNALQNALVNLPRNTQCTQN